MAYSEPVNEKKSDIFSVEEFKELCQYKTLIDYDGSGNPVKDGFLDPSITIVPSNLGRIPLDATHIVWYNR